MRFFISIFFIILFFTFSVRSNTENTIAIYDRGFEKCSSYITDYEQISSEYLIFNKERTLETTHENWVKIYQLEDWITFYFGYATAVNIANQRTRFDDSMNDKNVIAIELKNYCEDNPSKQFIHAVMDITLKYLVD